MAKDNPDDIHDNPLKLEEYRLEVLFRNKKFAKLIERVIAMDGRLVLLEGKPEYSKIEEHLSDLHDQLEKLLRSHKLHLGWRYINDVFYDYIFYLHKTGKTVTLHKFNQVSKDFPPHDKEGYDSIYHIAGVRLVHQTRCFYFEDFQKVTQFKLDHIPYDEAWRQRTVDVLRRILPIILKHYEKIDWSDPLRGCEASLSLSRGADQDRISQYEIDFLYSPGIYCHDTKRFYTMLIDGTQRFDKRLIPTGVEEHKFLDDNRLLTLKIDITKSKNDLTAKFKQLIDYFKAMDDDFIVLQRVQLALYGEYLKVWDLVQEKGKKWTEIAKEVFPEDFISDDALLESTSDHIPDPEGARIKAKQYYDAACKLVEEGLP